MTNDTNPDIVDKADALVGVADAVAGRPAEGIPRSKREENIGKAIRLYACSLYGHRPQWGELSGNSVLRSPLRVNLYKRTCQRCGRDLQPAERAKE